MDGIDVEMVFTAVFYELSNSVVRLEFQETCGVGVLWYEEYVSLPKKEVEVIIEQ